MRALPEVLRRRLDALATLLLRLAASVPGMAPARDASGSHLSPPTLIVHAMTDAAAPLSLTLRRTGTLEGTETLGAFHRAIIETEPQPPGSDLTLSWRGGPPARVTVLRATFLTRRLAALVAGLAADTPDPLRIVRTIRPAGAAPGRRETYVASDLRHFRAMVGLAAAEEAHAPPPAAEATPLVSLVVPVYNAAPAHLDDILASLRLQPEGLWELVFSDDASTREETKAWLEAHSALPAVRVVRNPENRGIAGATNAGLAAATGTWVGLLDHDDALAPFALARIARALAADPDCQFLYTDEFVTDAALRPQASFLKPAWNPVLLSGVNYVNHLSLYRRERLARLGGLRDGFQGSQDYELVLRYTRDLDAGAIRHLPYPAYLWRRTAGAFTARHLDTATASARAALLAHYAPHGVTAVEGAIEPSLHRVRFGGETRPPLSVVIPSRDAPDLIERVLEGLDRTDYPALDVIVIDNGSTDPRTLALYERRRAGPAPFRAVIEPGPFNFAAAVNRGSALARGEHILFLNNDVEILEPGWLEEMVSCLAYPGTGIVGAKLIYPDRTLQHAGVIAGYGGLAGHWYLKRPEAFPGMMGRLWVRQGMSCVTGACMLVSRACLDAAGGFDEADFAVAYNDVDYCLRARAAGFGIVWTPFACLIHHESASRGSDEAPDKIERFRREQAALRARHGTETLDDPAYNPWLSRYRAEPAPIVPAFLPGAR